MTLTVEQEIALIPERVEQGIQWLKANYPHGKIDMDKLNMQSSCCCVLGQSFGQEFPGRGDDYEDARAYHGLSMVDAIGLGFFRPEICSALRSSSDYMRYYGALEHEWRRRLA